MYLNTSGVFAWIIIILVIAKMLEYILEGIKYLWTRLKYNKYYDDLKVLEDISIVF